MNWVLRHGKRILRIAAGLALLVVGLVLSIPGVPGPGLVVAFVGLSILAIDFFWARRLRDGITNTAKRAAGRVRGTKSQCAGEQSGRRSPGQP